ncbi:MAG: hypothetical protein Q8M07_23595 [Prosthecobacter sp.]|nr:hypothetical protein [Prosthecobacter sp.]
MIRTFRRSFSILAAAFFAAISATAADKPVSSHGGITQVTLPATTTSALAVPYAKSIPFDGNITSVSGPTLGVSVTLTPGALTNHSIHICSRRDPSAAGAYGRVVRITGNTANTVDTDVNITPVVGDEFEIVENHTLASLFGAFPSTVSLLTGTLLSLSDVVFIENNGVFTGYWHKSGQGWRLQSDSSGSGASQNDVSIPFSKGVLVARKGGGSKTVVIQGESVGDRFRPSTSGGNTTHCLNNPFSFVTTLGTSGIGSFVTSSTLASLSDVIYIESSGVFLGYWRKSSNGNWYLESDSSGTGSTQNTVQVLPGKALLIKDRGAAVNGFAFPEPFNP